MSLVRELLSAALERNASDIHLKPGKGPAFRIDGVLQDSGLPAWSDAAWERLLAELISDTIRTVFEREKESDFSLNVDGCGRFRVNLFLSSGQVSVAIRHVKTEIPTLAELRLPPALKTFAAFRRGIVLLGGASGSGKSSTLAALLGEINRNREARIITVEDPVEYLFADERSLISQREVGLDTRSFRQALVRILRQDPDVIMIGEMRDAESFSAALSAAETGHLVLSTLHTSTASQSVKRILDFFPHNERDPVRMGLAANLRAVVCQRLLPAREGGVVPAAEILINTSTVRKIMENDQLERLDTALRSGQEDGMQSFTQSLLELLNAGLISQEQALLHATSPDELRMRLKGIVLDEGRRILST